MDRHEVQAKMPGGSVILMDISDAVKLDIPEGAIRIEVSATLYFEMWAALPEIENLSAALTRLRGS